MQVQNLKCKTKNNNLESLILNEKEDAQIFAKIYSSGKGSDSPRSFRFERTRKVNSRALSRII